MPVNAPRQPTVRLRALSLVTDGDNVIVGDQVSGTFIEIPAVGGVVIGALQRGANLDEAVAEAEAFAGAPVNVPEFIAALDELGFLAHDGQVPAGPEPVRTAPIQLTGWLGGISPRLARLLFGRAAWTCYVLCAVFAVGVFTFVPQLLPSPFEDAFILDDIGLSAVAWAMLGTLLSALHEGGHYIAARAIGLEARFGLDHRMGLLVYETDLSQLWRVPRERRYGTLLAGLAIDAALLAALLGLRLMIHAGHWSPPPLIDAVLAAAVFVQTGAMLWQCFIFMRTDLYAVLVNALNCRNLWRVKSLLLRRAFGHLSAAEADELADASPADIRVGRWFRWLWLSGLIGVLAWFGYFRLPVFAELLDWTIEVLARGPGAGAFWYGPICAAIAIGPQALALILAARSGVGGYLRPTRGEPRRREICR